MDPDGPATELPAVEGQVVLECAGVAGGIALGIDRWAMIFAGQTNIREVMAFPKTQSGTDPMLDAPSVPEPGQYDELGLRFVGLPERPS